LKNSKKIAVLCNYELLPTRVGGMDYFFWQFDAVCKQQAVHVDWFFPNQAEHGSYKQLTIYSFENIPIEYFFIEHLQQERPTYSHIITHFLELCSSFFKKVKSYSSTQVIAVDHNPRPIQGYPLRKQLEKKLKGLLYAKYIDVFVGVSAYTKRELIRDFGYSIASRTIVIYNGVLIDRIVQNSNRQPRKPKFLVASHLRESKGIQDLIVAVSLLPSSIREELVIDIYGDGPYRASLLGQIQEQGVPNCFKFKGSVPNLHEVYAHYDYMLQPTHMECFSLSILESLAADVPVITTNVGGNEEAVFSGVNGYIYPVGDYQALKVLIESLWLGELQIKGNTREAIGQQFTIQKMVENHYELIQS
jgi:glycosyltransferase involved in cell wall biosynthesis